MSTSGIESWASHSSYVHPVDLSAFISTSPAPMPPPPEDPPPYSEQLLDGHITLMSGAKTCKDEDDLIDPVNSSSVTAGDVSIMDRSSTSPGLASPDRHSQPVANSIQEQQPQSNQVPRDHYNDWYSYSTSMPISSMNEPMASQVQDPVSAQFISTPTTPPRPALPPNMEGHNPAFDYPTTALPSSVHFYRPRHRSLSADNTSVGIHHQLPQVPDGGTSTAQSVASLPFVTPFPPRTVPPLAPISQAPSNIAPGLSRGWMTNDPFERRPSRLPPLQRSSQSQGKGKKRRGHSWHEGTNSLPVLPIVTMNAVQE